MSPGPLKQTCIPVLGMHRSGTSALTRVLSLMGAKLPQNLLGAGPGNETGHWEPERLVELHDQMLAEAGSSWDDWRKLDLEAQLPEGRLAHYKTEIQRLLVEEYGDAPLFVLKDPRICRFFPLYREILEGMDVVVRPALMYRHPIEVAASLLARNGIAETQAELYWLRHILNAESTTRGLPRAVVSYDALLDDWRAAIAPIVTGLGIRWPKSIEVVGLEVDAFLSRNHQHHPVPSHAPVSELGGSEWAGRAYAALQALPKCPADATAEFDALAAVFGQATALFGRALAAERDERDRALKAEHDGDDAGDRALKAERDAREQALLVECEAREQLVAENLRLRRELETDRTARDQLHETYRNSTSWRVTAPLRMSWRLTGPLRSIGRNVRWHAFTIKGWRNPDPEALPVITQSPPTNAAAPPHEASSSAPAIKRAHGNSVDVVIPVHNRAYWLGWCLEELRKHPEGVRRIVVVNDRSAAAESKCIRDICLRFSVDLVENTSAEGGFAVACNLGFSHCTAPLTLFLNSDCFVTAGSIPRMAEVLLGTDEAMMICPLSNNSPELTFPIFPGHSYVSMASDIAASAVGCSTESTVFEACTVVGNCLLVQSSSFSKIGGFSTEWGLGYGEETDLQMRALAIGKQGLVDTASYVFHFGGGTFNSIDGVNHRRRASYDRFMSLWGREYRQLRRRSNRSPPLKVLEQRLEGFLQAEHKRNLELDVLFYLPGLDQGVGGLLAVVSICNELVKRGLNATCAVMGPRLREVLSGFKEPLLFEPLFYASDEDWQSDRAVLPKLVVSTIYTSSKAVADFAAARNSAAMQFIQGYEPYFENGAAFAAAVQSYRATRTLLVTSNFLETMVRPHLAPDQLVRRVPLIVNTDIFYSSAEERQHDVAFILRGAPDKGQWLSLELATRFARDGHRVLLFFAERYKTAASHLPPNTTLVPLPLDQYDIATRLRTARVYVDTSHHEGFGLMPFEAALCGCHVVVSASGGVEDIPGASIVPITAHPGLFVSAIQAQLQKASPAATPDYDMRTAARTWGDLVATEIEHVSPTLPLQRGTPLALKPALSATTLPGGNRPMRLRSHLESLYMRSLVPFLPRRVHLSLKMLIYGRI